jgi:hypothetical protein
MFYKYNIHCIKIRAFYYLVLTSNIKIPLYNSGNTRFVFRNTFDTYAVAINYIY